MHIASIQLNSQNNLDDNLRHISQAVQSAKQMGADLVVLPENACYMGRQADIVDKFDELKAFFQELSAKHAVNLIAGTLPCAFDKTNKRVAQKCYQTSLAFDSLGNCVMRYDKIHLFCANVADGVGSYDESKTFLAGDTLAVANFSINGESFGVGMMICFDLRFAKLAQSLRQFGADILVAPSAFTYATGQVYWQLLLQARAIDSQCLTVGSAQGGVHTTQNSERHTWGHSLISDCTGNILADTGATTNKSFDMALAYFDKAHQDKVRQDLPIFNCHRLA